MNRLTSALAGLFGVKHLSVLPQVLIAVLAAGGAAAFAYTGGWFSPDRLTPQQIAQAF
jgi:hypothetical protein